MKQLANRMAFALLAGLAVAGCTVQPLYAPAPAANAAQSPVLSSLYVEPVNNRVGQELRNALIFQLNGGSTQPASADYTVTLTVSSGSQSTLLIQTTSSDGEPTSQRVTVTANYELTRASDGVQIGKRRASASASYDVSYQEFANERAERDAENRAAREVAEQLRALIAADLSRAGAL